MGIKQNIKSLTYLLLGIVIGANSFAISSVNQMPIAVVDVPSIIEKSPKVKALKEEQTKKSQALAKWLATVNEDIKKQTNDVSKQKLLNKYSSELDTKKESNKNDYLQKLSEIDASISKAIVSKAKSNGYYIVIEKSSVLYGGEDITSDIAKIVK
jgi:outer membrane protein